MTTRTDERRTALPGRAVHGVSAAAQKFSAAVNERPFLVIPLFIALYGIRSGDVGTYCLLSASPLTLIPSLALQVRHSSPFVFFLGYPVTQLAGCRPSYVVVMGAGLVFFAFALKRFVAVRYGSRQNIAALMLLTTPILITLFQFVGKGDAYMAAFFFLFLTVKSPVWQTVCAALTVVSHREVGLLLLLSSAILNRANVRAAFAGAVSGALLIFTYHHYLLPSPPVSRSEAAVMLSAGLVSDLLANPIMHVVFTFGPFWVCVFSARRLGGRWLMLFLATLAIAAMTLDFTRVFALAALPLAIAVIDELTDSTPAKGEDQERLARLSMLLPFCALVQAQFYGDRLFDSRIPSLIEELNRMLRALN